MTNYISMPFRATLLGKSVLRCDLQTSIRQNLRLLLVTPPGRLRLDPFYGCKVHWSQFLASNRSMEGFKEEDGFKQKIEENITELIQRFEPRVDLHDVSVSIKYAKEQHAPWSNRRSMQIKRNVIQVMVAIRSSIRPEFAYGHSLQLEDTIALL